MSANSFDASRGGGSGGGNALAATEQGSVPGTNERDGLSPDAMMERLVDAVVDRLEQRVVEELERRGRRQSWTAF